MLIKSKVMLFMLSILIVGCISSTTDVWKKPTYNEAISQFLITEKGDKLIFIGEKYHYIFANETSLNSVLQWQDRGILKAAFYNDFSVDANNKVTGQFEILCFCHGATKEQIQWLENNGFHKLANMNDAFPDDGKNYKKQIQVSGDRYLSNNLSLIKYDKLNYEYRIQVETDFTALGIAGRIAYTPIAVAEDGVATLLLMPLLAIGLPFYVIRSVKENDEGK